MRMENRKHETGNGKPVIVHLFTSVFHFRFPVSGLLFAFSADLGEKIDTLSQGRGLVFGPFAKAQKNRAQAELNRTVPTRFCRLTAFSGVESLLALAHPLL